MNETASYMPLFPRRPEHDVYSGFSHSGGESIAPKQGEKLGKLNVTRILSCKRNDADYRSKLRFNWNQYF